MSTLEKNSVKLSKFPPKEAKKKKKEEIINIRK